MDVLAKTSLIKNGTIDLEDNISVDEITTRDESYLALPSIVKFGNLSLDADELETVDNGFLCIKGSKISLADSNTVTEDLSFTLNLGEGLKSEDGSKSVIISNSTAPTIQIDTQSEKEKEENIGNRRLTYFNNPYTILKTNNSSVCCRFASNKEVYSTFVKHNTNGTDYNILGFNNTTSPSDESNNKLFIWPGKLKDDDELYNAAKNIGYSYYSLACLANDIEQYNNAEDVNSLRTLNKFPLTITKKENEKIFSIKYTDTNGNTATLDNITNIKFKLSGDSDENTINVDVNDENIDKLKNLGKTIEDETGDNTIKVVYGDTNNELEVIINEIYKEDSSCISSVITFSFTVNGEDKKLEFETNNYIWSIETSDEVVIKSIAYHKNKYDEVNNKITPYTLVIDDNNVITSDYKVDNIFLLKNSCIKAQVEDETTPVYKIIIKHTKDGEEISQTIDLNEYDLIHVNEESELTVNKQRTSVKTGCYYFLDKHKELPIDYDSAKILPEISDDATSVILNYEWSSASDSTTDVKGCSIGYMLDFDIYTNNSNSVYDIGTKSTVDSSFTYNMNIADENFVSGAIIPLIKENTDASSKTFEIPITEGADGNKYFCLYASEKLTIKLLGYRV